MDDNCAGDYYPIDKALRKRIKAVSSKYMA